MSATAPILLWAGVLALAVYMAVVKGRETIVEAIRYALRLGIPLMPRLALAILAASFLAQIIPPKVIGNLMGDSSGLGGIVIASLLGGIIPGGPMVSFPIAIYLWDFGAGIPQMVALLSAWSVFAIHRVMMFELPMMGWRFVVLRLLTVAIIPPLTGLLAMVAIVLHGGFSIASPGGGL